MTSSDPEIVEFLSIVKRSGIVDHAALDAAIEEYTPEGTRVNLTALSQFLVDRHLITSWQCGKLLKGKHRGFFLGKYKLLALLGKGGMSSVYLAEHTVMKRQCALKVLPHKLVNDSSYLERFHREAQAVAALDHPNIVRAYDIDATQDGQLEIHFLVMEFIQGHNFFELVRALGPLKISTAVDYIRQAALGLQHAHDAGLVHRDIKPGNFIVDGQGDVKMMDLGLAKTFANREEFSLTMMNDEKILGTADYLAPEQAVDSHRVDTRADIYGLGCTFYFLLTGRPPYDDGSLAQRLLAHQTKKPHPIRKLRPEIPEEIDLLIREMLQKKPNRRIQTAREVAERLQKWLDANSSDSSPDAVSHLPVRSVDAILSDPPASGSQDTDELVDFLSHLEGRAADAPTQSKSPDSTQKLKANAAELGLHVTQESSKISHSASGRSKTTDKAKRKPRSRDNSKLWTALTIATLMIAAAVMFMLAEGDREPRNDGDDRKSQTVNTPPGEEGSSTMHGVAPAAPTISVGPDGDFRKLSEAIAFVQAEAMSAGFREIRIAGGQTIEDNVMIDNSGINRLPPDFKILGEGPDFPVLTGNNDVILTMKSVEGLTLSDLIFDAAKSSRAIQIEGYTTKSVIRNVTVQNISQSGIVGHGVSGLTQKPVIIDQCQFSGQSGADSGISFESSNSRDFNVSGTRQVQIKGCRFLGPMNTGIRFSELTWDAIVERSIFFQLENGVIFDGAEQDVTRVIFCNNTFCKLQRGIDFQRGPIEAASGVTFLQNLFVNIDKGAVMTQRENVSVEEFSKGNPSPRDNVWTSVVTDSPHHLDIFEVDVQQKVGRIEFRSTDPNSNVFLKPTNSHLQAIVSQPYRKAAFIGAVRP